MQKFLEYVKKKFFNKNEEEEEEIGSYSMNEGKTDKVFGINRRVVKGIAIFFTAIFVIATVYAAFDRREEVARVDEPKQITENEIADADRVKNNLPSDYASFVEMTQAKQTNPQQQNLQPQSPQPEKVAPKQEEVKIPSGTVTNLPRSSYPEIVVPQQSQVMPQIQIPNPVPKIEKSEAEEKKAEPEKAKHNAPIAFASFSGDKQPDSAVEEEKPVKVSYKKTSEGTLGAGTIISVRLLTGINTELSGRVTAQIISDVYNTGRTKLLIPQGSKIIGTYESEKVNHGRVPINFEKLIMPDGTTVKLEKNFEAVDGAGYTGIKGKVHHHTGQKVTAGVMGAAIAAIGATAAGNTSSSNGNYSAGELAKQGAMANMMNVTSKMFEEATKIKDTVTVEPGYEFQIYVIEELEF